MTISLVQHGAGPVLLLIPGIQGRCEYVEPTIHALARFFRVVAIPLAGEGGVDGRTDRGQGIAPDVARIEAAMEEVGVRRAIVCGISFGGLVALRFAATRPEQTSALVLASAPGPDWRLRPRHELYARIPWLFGPLFLAEAPLRLRRELLAALPGRTERWAFNRSQFRTLVRAPLSVARMAARARTISTLDLRTDCERIEAPTLVVTGEPALDYVVPAGGTSEYARLIRNARHHVLERTGHLGTITHPHDFARVLVEFIRSSEEHRLEIA